MAMQTASKMRPRARQSLDRRLEAWMELPSGAARPHGGWVRAIREALGMTTADLANRMGLTQSTVTRLESSERHRTIRLDTLARAAEAMDCDLVYALVPRKPLQELVSEQAGRKAAEHLRRLTHTMALEEQGLDRERIDDNYELLHDHYLNAPGLWHEEPRSGSSTQT